jgi:DNA-3-methyladenine glycosylase II
MNAPPAQPRQLALAIRQGRDHLAMADPVIAALDPKVPDFAIPRRPGGFAGLVKMVVEQQVSIAAAAAISGRFEAGLGQVTPARVLASDEDHLKTFGLSRPKARYAREIARHQIEGLIDFDHLERLDDAQAIAALTAIKGVGLWTAESYLLFCEGRLDVFPGGDVALQAAMAWADGAQARPDAKQAYARAEIWRPYRAVAAMLLWRAHDLR